MDPTWVFNFFMFFERILYKSNCIIFIFSWFATHTKIRSKLVVIVTAGSQKITLWGPQRTPLGVLRVKASRLLYLQNPLNRRLDGPRASLYVQEKWQVCWVCLESDRTHVANPASSVVCTNYAVPAIQRTIFRKIRRTVLTNHLTDVYRPSIDVKCACICLCPVGPNAVLSWVQYFLLPSGQTTGLWMRTFVPVSILQQKCLNRVTRRL